MRKLFAVAAFVLAVGGLQTAMAQGNGNGNPRPGFPHDTIIIHVQKAASGPKNCDGGHSLFLRYGEDFKIPDQTLIQITMIDWNQVDNDGDGLFDEDPEGDADGDNDPNDDGDALIDEDGPEPGAETTAIDCDSWGDNLVSLQIRDTDPRPGIVSVQEWFMRMIGKPEENFAFWSYANQKISCTILSDNGTPDDPTDDIVSCVSEVGTVADWVQLAYFNLADGVDGVECVKQVKLRGNNNSRGGGRTPFCDITDGFEVDVDTSDPLDDIPDLFDQFVFSISCFNDPATPYDETQDCPLSSVIWEIDESEGGTTTKAHVQIFVSHTGSASVKNGRIVRN